MSPPTTGPRTHTNQKGVATRMHAIHAPKTASAARNPASARRERCETRIARKEGSTATANAAPSACAAASLHPVK
jgi:hypothetical protein